VELVHNALYSPGSSKGDCYMLDGPQPKGVRFTHSWAEGSNLLQTKSDRDRESEGERTLEEKERESEGERKLKERARERKRQRARQRW